MCKSELYKPLVLHLFIYQPKHYSIYISTSCLSASLILPISSSAMTVKGTPSLILSNFTFLQLPKICCFQKVISFKKAEKPRSSNNLVSVYGGNVEARFGSSFTKGGGAGVLERPSFDQSQFDPLTQVEQGGDIGRSKHKKGIGSGDGYRVLLIDDPRHTEALVARVLPQAVPSVSSEDAKRLFRESKEHGLAVVIVTVKEHAEFYAQMMARGGLRSTIEPESNLV